MAEKHIRRAEPESDGYHVLPRQGSCGRALLGKKGGEGPMNFFRRFRRGDVPELEIRGDEATVVPRTVSVEEPPPVPEEPDEPRQVKLPPTVWA